MASACFPLLILCGDACLYWMSSETPINNQHLDFCHSFIILRCSCWFNWIDSGAWSYSFSGKQMERTYWLEPQFVYFHSYSAAFDSFIQNLDKTHHKGSNGAYDGYFQLPRPLLLCRNWRNKWPIFTTSKWKVSAGFSAVTRSFKGRSVVYPSFPFSFPLARKEDEEALKTTETDFNNSLNWHCNKKKFVSS